MVTLKEYEIYLKVKKFIETIDCDEDDIIPRLTNGVGIIPAYVHRIRRYESQLNITLELYRLLRGGVDSLSK